MPVFYNPEAKTFALVSYKVLFSAFTASTDWVHSGEHVTWRHLRKALTMRVPPRFYQIVRHPVGRVESCFLDKYRKQPQRIHEPGFSWQACHELLYPDLGIHPLESDEEKAKKFMTFSFDRFVGRLPELLDQDSHFFPQVWTRHIYWKDRSLAALPLPVVRIIRREDGLEALSEVPGIDFTRKTNVTSHIARDYEVTARHRRMIERLYRDDYLMGGYPRVFPE